jgi:putative SOS response-associated peptidase YedK
MAGLWEQNSKADPDGSSIWSCTVITTAANASTRSIHDRMPALLDAADFDRWLDPHHRDGESLKRLLRPAPDDWFEMIPVSRRVNSPKVDSEQCIQPLTQGNLFD